jgi:CRISPR-associated protein Cas1
MKKLLNTLYITRQESYLHKDHETIVVKNGDEKLGQFPALSVGNILCFGQISVSPFLMGYCAEKALACRFIQNTEDFWQKFKAGKQAMYYYAVSNIAGRIMKKNLSG